jgi:SAM-dependent methyltransferase
MPVQQRDITDLYDRYYFEHYTVEHDGEHPYQRDEHWLRFFGQIADHIVEEIAPRTVLDAGCAMGFLVEALRDRGIDAFGLDVSEYAIKSVREDVQPHCRVASIADPLAQRYDLVVCIEVLEHLSRDQAEQAIDNLCGHTDDIIFSSTPDEFKEVTHINVRPPESWAEAFARRGFVRDVDYDPSYIAGWAVRYRRTTDPLPRAIGGYERLVARLGRENRELRQLAIQQRQRVELTESDSLELRAVKQTLTWRFAERSAAALRRVFPRQTVRGKTARLLARGVLRPLERRPPSNGQR